MGQRIRIDTASASILNTIIQIIKNCVLNDYYNVFLEERYDDIIDVCYDILKFYIHFMQRFLDVPTDSNRQNYKKKMLRSTYEEILNNEYWGEVVHGV